MLPVRPGGIDSALAFSCSPGTVSALNRPHLHLLQLVWIQKCFQLKSASGKEKLMKFILDTGQHTRCDSPSNTFERFNCFTTVLVHPIVLLRFQRIFTSTIAMNALSIIIRTFYPFNLATNSLCLKLNKSKHTIWTDVCWLKNISGATQQQLDHAHMYVVCPESHEVYLKLLWSANSVQKVLMC